MVIINKNINIIKWIIFSLLVSFILASKVSAGVTLDLTPPSCSIGYNPNTTSPTINSKLDISVLGDDSQTGGTGIASNTLTKTQGPDIANLPITSASNPLTFNWQISSPGTFTFSATSTDGAGNINTICVNTILADIIVDNTSPWLRTTGGDIHSNTLINSLGQQ